MNANVDLMYKGGGKGDIAAYMLEKGKLDPGNLRPFIKDGRAMVTIYRGHGDVKDPASYVSIPTTNATLRRDEWKMLDSAVISVAQQRLGGADDVVSRGLTYNLGNGMGTTVLEWHDVSDALTAELTMDGITRADNDRPEFQHNYLPIPIIHADYEINERALMVSRNMGNPLDTTLAERAARRVQEKLESMFFTDTSYSYGEADSRSRNTIYSYLNFPDRNALTGLTDWDASAKTGKQIVEDVLAMKQESIDNLFYGPWQLYIPTGYETILDADYVGANPDTAPNTTIRERILKIAGITGIKVIDFLPANNILMIQMTSDVVRLVQGMGLQNVQWQTEGKLINKYKVMTIQVPQIRSDQNGKTGIVHLS